MLTPLTRAANCENAHSSKTSCTLPMLLLAVCIGLTACGGSDSDSGVGSSGETDIEQVGTDDTTDLGEIENEGNTDNQAATTMTPDLNSAPADVPGGSYLLNSNNSAILTGPVFGSGNRTNSSLVKSLSFSTQSVVDGLEIVELRAVDETFGFSGGSTFLGIIRNNSSQFYCGVVVEDSSIFSSDGTELSDSTINSSRIEGVVGVSPTTGSFFDDCIAPGSLAYFRQTLNAPFEEAAEVRFENIVVSQLPREPLAGSVSVIPTSYTVAPDGTVSVTITNQHSEQLEVNSFIVVALDEVGHAITANLDFLGEVLDPGQELIVEGQFSMFEGQASTLRAIVDFSVVD